MTPEAVEERYAIQWIDTGDVDRNLSIDGVWRVIDEHGAIWGDLGLLRCGELIARVFRDRGQEIPVRSGCSAPKGRS